MSCAHQYSLADGTCYDCGAPNEALRALAQRGLDAGAKEERAALLEAIETLREQERHRPADSELQKHRRGAYLGACQDFADLIRARSK